MDSTTDNKLKMSSPLLMGAKLLKGAEADAIDLGPLADLKGQWIGESFMGWNVIAVPGPLANGGSGGFILEVIPYRETLKFTPVVVAGNRGVFADGKQSEQQITGLMYEQVVTSVCDTDVCKKMGFSSGTEIHAETGLLLYVKDCIVNSGQTACGDAEFSIARLSTVPHGNSILALGTSFVGAPDNNDFFGEASTMPVPVNSGDRFTLAYTDPYTRVPQFPQFNQRDPNTFLKKTLDDAGAKITAMTTLNMSTKNETGGILNIPFATTKVQTMDMEATFWIEQIEGQAELQLQYSQTINLKFPGHGMKDAIPVIWPHVTISTLKKVSEL
jgi:hypothetical protein